MCGQEAIIGLGSDNNLDGWSAWGTLHGGVVPKGTLEDGQCTGQWLCVSVSYLVVSDSL